MVELGQPNGGVAQLVVAVVPGLRESFPDEVRVELETRAASFASKTLGLERLARADAGDVTRERSGEPRDRP